MKELIDLPEVSEANYPIIFCKGGLKPFIDAALAEAELIKKELPDVSTKKGRTAIASAAAKVSKSKTAIEKPGAIYTKKIKAEGVAIASELSAFKKAMDSIRDDVQAPLIAYKEKERLRIEKLEGEIEFIFNHRNRSEPETGEVFTSEFLKDNRDGVAAMAPDEIEFGDLHEKAMKVWSETLESLDASIIEVTAAEEMKAENDRLKEEAVEAKRKAEIEEAMRHATAGAEMAAADKIAKAEYETKLAIENQEKRAAEEVEKALEDVRQQDANKVMVERLKKEAAESKAADVNHRKEVNNRALNELMQCCEGLTNDQAMKIVKGMASGNFTDLTINY